jgi:hypothetical protein
MFGFLAGRCVDRGTTVIGVAAFRLRGGNRFSTIRDLAIRPPLASIT